MIALYAHQNLKRFLLINSEKVSCHYGDTSRENSKAACHGSCNSQTQ